MIVSAYFQIISRTMLKFPSITQVLCSTTRATFSRNLCLSSICQFFFQKSESSSICGIAKIRDSVHASVVFPKQLVPMTMIRFTRSLHKRNDTKYRKISAKNDCTEDTHNEMLNIGVVILDRTNCMEDSCL